MPRKQGVGMPKRRKKKVVRVEAGASVDTIEGEVAVAEEEPPASPIPTHNPHPPQLALFHRPRLAR